MKSLQPLLVTLLLSTLMVPALVAARTPPPPTPIIDYRERFLPVVGSAGMVAGPERLASEVGASILRQGGNAVDAAVATGFALAVTYPRAGNLGGGGFMLIHLNERQTQTFIDYRETAPAAANKTLFLNEHGQVDITRERFSHQSAGVPGTVAGMLLALEKYGSMSREQVLAPAIALARDGIAVSFALNFEVQARAKNLRKNPESSRLFFKPDGSAYQIGEHWRQPDLAATLQHIAKRGKAGFYEGEVARLIVAEMQAGNGLISAADLAGYAAIERPPVRGRYRGFEIVSAPPPSSGGLHIIQMLNILEGYDLAAMGHNSAAYLHHLNESMRLAYADRSKFLGDPDFVDIPVSELTDKAYAARLRKVIDSNRATRSDQILPGGQIVPESQDTTHYTVADRHGNMVTNTYTLNFSFGSGIAVPGTGMLLNNEMADFAAKPGLANAFGLVQGDANAIQGGKRPLSSMTPTLVLQDGKPWLATGSPGGSIIITTVLQLLLNAMEFDQNIAAAAASARVHHQWRPDKLWVERGISPDTIKLLRDMGHTVETGNRTLGRTQSIMLENARVYGASDPRRPGGWVAVE